MLNWSSSVSKSNKHCLRPRCEWRHPISTATIPDSSTAEHQKMSPAHPPSLRAVIMLPVETSRAAIFDLPNIGGHLDFKSFCYS